MEEKLKISKQKTSAGGSASKRIHLSFQYRDGVTVLVAATRKRRRSLDFALTDSIKPTSSDPLACWETFKRIPTAASVGTSEEPPYEMKGSGIPFVGSNERTTLILNSA